VDVNCDPEARHTRGLLIPATRRCMLIEESKAGPPLYVKSFYWSSDKGMNAVTV